MCSMMTVVTRRNVTVVTFFGVLCCHESSQHEEGGDACLDNRWGALELLLTLIETLTESNMIQILGNKLSVYLTNS